ncbi:hypothetical protein IMC75_07855 [Campylobacter peloridis]|uniref:Uncharacterized protein n=1 Tax=Campylobacter peloridis TaxID=488546 RepID=A0ABX6TS06_9BACT|nr:hypothetical protein [Campylobacter peloridis]AJC84774.1 hypothetical protein CPEL_0956 [Campylobacter peloridis LMG 23910]QOQ88820.1 hypothetical protein IMC75_07855 [Campylobacter peloridis]
MSNNKNILQHIDDLVNGIFDSTVMTALEFGHFVIKIIGVENIILDDNTKQDEAIEQAEVFYKAIKLIISNDQIRKQAFQFLKQDFQKQPLYYIGSIVGPGAVVSLIKKPTQKILYFSANKTQQAFNLSNNSLYPYYKNIQNSFTPLCSIDDKNSNLLKEFNFDSFSCNFYNNNIFNQSLKYLDNIQDEKEYINEYKIFLENLNHFNQEYNNYKLMSIQVINNLKIAYIQKLSLEDINNINIDSKPYLLKALYFCEDYVLYDKDKQALFDENTIKELEFNSSFYTIFISHKNKLNDTYLNARKELYKSIDEFKRLGFKDLEHAYQTYMSSFIINEELNSKDKTINKNENKEINKNLNQESDTKESINFKELSLNSNQENNTKQSNTIIDDIKEDFKIVSYHLKNLSHFILENKEKNKKLIFFDNASSMSNLLHLYENNCDIFVKDESLIDIALLEQNYNLDFNKLKTRVFFYEKLLLGAKEDEIFSFNDEKINYYLKYDENNLYALKDLNITYDYYHCKIKNYVLAKNSLNIKLEPKKISKRYAYDDLNHQDLNLTHNNTNIINNTATSNYISLIIQDEHGKAIDNASISIKGYDHEKLIKQSVLRLKTNKEGKIRFDREKDFSSCHSFKVRLKDNKAYLAKPLQDSKRIFNNYINHKIGLILRFKNKDYFKYDGFYLYHFKGKDLIASYIARSGVAKADNLKPSNKQIAFSFYQDIKDKTTKKKAYFYYDDESIKDKFGSLPEGKYYFKINEINYNKQPDFLKDYPFSIGKTWGKYCVRLYTDKECSKSFKEIEISNPNNEKEKSKNKESMSKGDLYNNAIINNTNLKSKKIA